MHPLEWYVALVPEVEENEGEDKFTSQALKLLDRDRSDAAIILRQTILAETAKEDKASVVLLSVLPPLLKKPIEDPSSEELYQVAADRLAQSALQEGRNDDALSWFQVVLEERMRARSGDASVRWLRPPDVLMTYQLYRSLAGMKGGAIDEAAQLLTNCPKFKEEFNTHVYSAYAYFKDPDAWTKGTPFDSTMDYDAYITKQLTKGWRY